MSINISSLSEISVNSKYSSHCGRGGGESVCDNAGYAGETRYGKITLFMAYKYVLYKMNPGHVCSDYAK